MSVNIFGELLTNEKPEDDHSVEILGGRKQHG